jgi:hypothetical protein
MSLMNDDDSMLLLMMMVTMTTTTTTQEAHHVLDQVHALRAFGGAMHGYAAAKEGLAFELGHVPHRNCVGAMLPGRRNDTDELRVCSGRQRTFHGEQWSSRGQG